MSIGSAIFARLMVVTNRATDRQTDRRRDRPTNHASPSVAAGPISQNLLLRCGSSTSTLGRTRGRGLEEEGAVTGNVLIYAWKTANVRL